MIEEGTELIPVGRLLLRKKDGPSPRERLALLEVEKAAKRIRRKKDRLPMGRPALVSHGLILEDGDCRALKLNEEQCTKGRIIFSFFCSAHERAFINSFSDGPCNSVKTINMMLETIGFPGFIHKDGGTYHFKYSGGYEEDTEIARVNEISLRRWMTRAMESHEYTYMKAPCLGCGKQIRLITTKGFKCTCGETYCPDCWETHKGKCQSGLHKIEEINRAFEALGDKERRKR